MKIPPVEIAYIQEVFAAAGQEVVDAFEDTEQAGEGNTGSPDLAMDAMSKLLDIFRRFDNDRQGSTLNPARDCPLSPEELLELGNYGLRLLAEMAAYARQAGLDGRAVELQQLALPLALWVARCGGEISALELVVDALAGLANETKDPVQLEQLCRLAAEVVEAVDPSVDESDRETGNPLRPWRLLLLNWGIIATRSHRPPLMEQAFQAIVEHMPEDASRFFREGMEQMEALDYPPHVREVVERYFTMWGTPRTLH